MTSNKAPPCEQRDEMDNNACDHTPCQPQVVALPPPDGGSGTKASRKARNRRGKSDMTELKKGACNRTIWLSVTRARLGHTMSALAKERTTS